MPNFPATGPASSNAPYYATLSDLKTRLQISGVATFDTQLLLAINVASRRIDTDCDRVFYATTAVRYFTADSTSTLFLNDDLRSVTEIALVSSSVGGARAYGWILNTDEYDLEPYYGPPYTRISINPGGRYAFPRLNKSVRISGSYGYCFTGQHPQAIREACLLSAARLFERSKAPMGVVNGADFGGTTVTQTDYDYYALIAPYRRMEMLSAAAGTISAW